MNTQLMNIKAKLVGSIRAVTIAVPAIMLASGLSILHSVPVHAFPSNCSSGFVQNGGWATCSGGSGQYRVVLGCQNIFGFWENPVGPWKNVGQGASVKYCSFGYGVKWTGFNARD